MAGGDSAQAKGYQVMNDILIATLQNRAGIFPLSKRLEVAFAAEKWNWRSCGPKHVPTKDEIADALNVLADASCRAADRASSGGLGVMVKASGEVEVFASPALARHLPSIAQRPNIICLCGSTRFIETFAVKTWELEREGNVVLGCTLLPEWYCNVPDHFGEATGTKAQCDELHKRKIDLADEVLVLNVGGYIGESTRIEIEYAVAHGKPVRYLETQG